MVAHCLARDRELGANIHPSPPEGPQFMFNFFYGLDSQLFDEALVASSNAIFKIIVLVVLGVIFTFQGESLLIPTNSLDVLLIVGCALSHEP